MRNQDIDAARQGLCLRPVRHAAEDGGDGEAHVAAVGAGAIGDLGGELARRRQHKHAAAAARARGRRLAARR